MVDSPLIDAPQQQGGRQRQYGVEPRLHYLVYRDFKTMDTQQSRIGLPADHLSWLENLQPVGANNLVQVPGPAAPTASIPGKTVFREYYATYGGVDYTIMFMSDGSAYQVNLAGGAQVNFAPPGTFANPDMCQYASDRILIVDSSAAYCEWDGSVFVKAGGVSPNIVITNGGSGYSSAPSVTIGGGSGSGATATAVVNAAGAVVSVVLTAAGSGFKAGDTLTVTFGGPGTSAAATAIVWPIITIPNLTSIAVFQGRVWMAGNRTLLWTGTKGFDDVLAADASGSTILADSDLPHRITAVRALNNFLYLFGDGSVKQIGTIAVSSGVTLFTILTLTSDQGTLFLNSVVAYDRLVVFANYVGVYAIFGATVEKISDPMDGLYNTIDFTLQPQAVVTDVNHIKVFMLLVRIKDPVNGARSVFLSFFSKKWFLISQGIGTIVSNILTCCDATIGGISQVFTSQGPDVTQILANVAQPLQVLVRTALNDDRKPYMNKRGIRVGVAQSATATGTVFLSNDTENTSIGDQYPLALAVNWVNALNQVVTFTNASGGQVVFASAGFLFKPRQFAGTGIYMGITFSGVFQQFVLNGIVIEYEDSTAMRSINHR